MSIILELREHLKHSGTCLVHPTSEDVVLSNVFGVVKNLPVDLVLVPWLREVTGTAIPDSGWTFSFWEKQPRPIGIREGNTTVDLILESNTALVFVEVKMDAPASSGTANDPNRNQLVRNLDIGYRRAADAGKDFVLVFLTPDIAEPSLVAAVRSGDGPFPVNPEVSPSTIASCLHWASWASVGDMIAAAYSQTEMGGCEKAFARDLLAYLAQKRLWKNRLVDEPLFYMDKLYRSLRLDGSPFVPYAMQRPERYEGWRGKSWDEGGLRVLLGCLRLEDKALLKVLADAGGAMRQDQLMARLPMLRGKTGASLRALKAHINRQCKQLDRAPLLLEGNGAGPSSRHEINPMLGPLRAVVIAAAKLFEVDWQLLEPPPAGPAVLAVSTSPTSQPAELTPSRARIVSSKGKAWFVIRRTATPEIAAFVDAKGSCSYRRFRTSGTFIGRQRSKGEFRTVFSAVIANGIPFFPARQPALEDAEKNGLPADILKSARVAIGKL
jgi:hypothetical protein